MEKNKFNISLSVILVLTGFQIWFGCSAPYKPAREFLTSNQAEGENFGLYSYILFSQKPDKEDSVKYAEMISGYLNKIPELEQLSNYLPDSSINVVYFPVMEEPGYYFNNLSLKEQIDWVIANYDYARASVLLNKFEDDLLDGPYIVSYHNPLSQVSNVITEKYLLQDFSQVHPKAVSLWVDEFLKQSSQTEYWNGEHLRTFSNTLRNAIAIAAEGLQEVGNSFSWWQKSLKSWIVLK
jgi:hypothetical protein